MNFFRRKRIVFAFAFALVVLLAGCGEVEGDCAERDTYSEQEDCG